MTDDLTSVPERDPCLGPGKAEQRKLACRPHQLVIDAPAPTSAAHDKTPARTFPAPTGVFFSIVDEFRLSVLQAVHSLLNISSWFFFRLSCTFAPS